VRRSAAGIFLVVGGICFALAAGLWWMQRVAFTPTASVDSAVAILDDDAIRSEVATVIATSTAGALSRSPTDLKEYIEGIIQIRGGAALLAPTLRDAHQRVIGDRDDPVTIEAAVQMTIVRDELAALVPPVTLTVQTVTALEVVHTIAWWLTIVAAGLGVLLVAAAIVFRPERGEGMYAFGVSMGALAVFLIVFGFLVPFAVLPAMSDSAWTGIFPRLANEHRLVTLVAAAVSAGICAAVLLRGGSQRQRRQWSTPLGVGRSHEQHSWSR
jgi:hypothetical protein